MTKTEVAKNILKVYDHVVSAYHIINKVEEATGTKLGSVRSKLGALLEQLTKYYHMVK